MLVIYRYIDFLLMIGRHEPVHCCMEDGARERPYPPDPLVWSIAIVSDFLAADSPILQVIQKDLPWKFPRPTANAKHLAGFIPAPVYPGASPAPARLIKPRLKATRKGPMKGPVI